MTRHFAAPSLLRVADRRKSAHKSQSRHRSYAVSRRRWVIWGSLVLIAFASVAAAEDGWSLSKLNPFRKSSSSTSNKRARAKVSDESSSWKWPSLPSWGSKSPSTKRKNEPSTLSKMNKGTKNLMTKTKDTLMPWSKSSKSTPTRSASATKKDKEKKSTFASWFPSKEEEKKPTKTVVDFLGEKRPESDY